MAELREILQELSRGENDFSLGKRVLYLCAPDGIGQSKLAAKVDRVPGVPATGH